MITQHDLWKRIEASSHAELVNALWIVLVSVDDDELTKTVYDALEAPEGTGK